MMTPEAKKALSNTIRGLRQRLLEDLRLATESAYRLSVQAQEAGLDEAARTKRQRLENWLDEQLRAQAAGGRRRQRDDFLREAEQQAAYTLLNRLVILRLMEEPGPSGQPLRKAALIKGGWGSTGVLQVDAFREAIGGHQDRHLAVHQFVLQLADAFHPLLRWQITGDSHHHMRALGQFLLQLLRQVVGGGPETTEDHRPEALRQKRMSLGTRVITSPDGTTWMLRNTPADLEWRAVCWAPECKLLVAVARTSGAQQVMTSADGLSWTLRPSAADRQWSGICWAPQLGRLVAVAQNGSGSRVMSSC